MSIYKSATFKDLFSEEPTYIVVDKRGMVGCQLNGEDKCVFNQRTHEVWIPHVVIPITDELKIADAQALANKICEALNQ